MNGKRRESSCEPRRAAGKRSGRGPASAVATSDTSRGRGDAEELRPAPARLHHGMPLETFQPELRRTARGTRQVSLQPAQQEETQRKPLCLERLRGAVNRARRFSVEQLGASLATERRPRRGRASTRGAPKPTPGGSGDERGQKGQDAVDKRVPTPGFPPLWREERFGRAPPSFLGKAIFE